MMRGKVAPEKSRFRLLGIGLGVGIACGLFIGRRLARTRKMPFLDLWQQALALEVGEIEAACRAARMQTRYEALMASRPHLANRTLRFHLEMILLPGLALYEVLGETKMDQDKRLEAFETLFKKTLEPIEDMMASFERFKDPFGAFKYMVHWALRVSFPKAGWEIDLKEDGEDCISLEVHRCFYRDLLEFFGAPELTEVFCRMDDVMFRALPSSIVWERSMTIGQGGSCCDFRWCRQPQKEGEEAGALAEDLARELAEELESEPTPEKKAPGSSE